jgi:anti-sigma regulatory factor (Ser/Thr protein kinase)
LSAPEPKELTVRADLAEVDRVRGFLRENLRGLTVTEEDVLKLELSLHEIFVNIALYAYPQASGEMSVRVWSDDGTFFMEIRDRGVPFNPADRPPPDLDEKIRRGTRGGFGVYLFKTLMDGFTYERAGGENVLTVYKKL